MRPSTAVTREEDRSRCFVKCFEGPREVVVVGVQLKSPVGQSVALEGAGVGLHFVEGVTDSGKLAECRCLQIVGFARNFVDVAH